MSIGCLLLTKAYNTRGTSLENKKLFLIRPNIFKISVIQFSNHIVAYYISIKILVMTLIEEVLYRKKYFSVHMFAGANLNTYGKSNPVDIYNLPF